MATIKKIWQRTGNEDEYVLYPAAHQHNGTLFTKTNLAFAAKGITARQPKGDGSNQHNRLKQYVI